jgi:hypothetical protein
MIAATCATLLFVAAAGVYLNKSSGKKSSAVLAGGGSSDGGAEGGALPPLDESSRKVVWDERNTAPGAAATGETTTETPSAPATSEPVAVTLVTYYLDKDGDTFGSESTRVSLDPSEKKPEHVMQGGDCDDGNKSINPRAAEACGDIGVDNNCNGDTDDVDGAETVVDWYLDEDDDGYRVSEGAIRGCSSGPPDLGQVKRIKAEDSKGVDECPANPAKHFHGECGCDWAWPEENLDGSKEPDCLDDDDCDGIKNKDEGDWRPNPARGRVLQELRRQLELIRAQPEWARRNDGYLPSSTTNDYRTFVRQVADNARAVAQDVGAAGAAISNLSKAQSEMHSDDEPAHRFVLKLWPSHATERLDDCETRKVWRAILEDMVKIVEVLEETKTRLLNDGSQFPEKGTNSKSDFTRGDARRYAQEQWRDVEKCFDDCKIFLNRDKLQQELAALKASEDSPGNSNQSAGAK